jgi:hypothetical protein
VSAAVACASGPMRAPVLVVVLLAYSVSSDRLVPPADGHVLPRTRAPVHQGLQHVFSTYRRAPAAGCGPYFFIPFVVTTSGDVHSSLSLALLVPRFLCHLAGGNCNRPARCSVAPTCAASRIIGMLLVAEQLLHVSSECCSLQSSCKGLPQMIS